MMKLVIFDMDGTIADTSPGIFGSIRYTQKKMGLPEITKQQMYSHVGPPMEESYAKNFGLSGERLKTAVAYHKEYAMARGYKELKIYDGIPELLADLKERGLYTAIATLKAQSTAEKILSTYKLELLFDLVIGTDASKPMKKEEMLSICMDRLSCTSAETVLVGDSIYDEKAAAQIGIGFIAVTYGFGFKAKSDVSRCICCCDSTSELRKCLK